MNETMTTLLNRRCVRAFRAEQITDEELNAVLEAGKYAPSGANQQSALFIVVQDRDTRETLSRMNRAVNGGDSDPYYGAPTVVLVLADTTKVTPVEDASLALGNMFNAAHALGLGSCWVHRERQMFESDEARRCFASGAWRVTTSAWEPAFLATPTANARWRPRARTASS